MPAAVAIEQAHVHYRMARASLARRARLDAVFRRTLEGLALALRDRGLDPERPICVRRLEAHVRLSLQDGDGPLEASWLRQLADSIAAEARTAGREVIVYRSRRQALAELVAEAAVGNLTRVWAWTQLGLWSRGQTADAAMAVGEALRALASDPPAIVPVLVAMAARGRLAELLLRGRDGAWAALAGAASMAAGGGTRTALARPDGAASDGVANAGFTPEGTRQRRSAGFETTGTTARAGIGEALDQPRRMAASLIAATARRLGATLSVEKLRACARLAALEVAPGPVGARAKESEETAPRTAAPEEATALDDELAAATTPVPNGAEEVAVEQPAVTAAGGLLFLLHVARDLELPVLIAAEPALAARDRRAVLLLLGARLAPTNAGGDDPAVRAFAGLGPRDRIAFDRGPWAEADQALDRLRARLVAALAKRVGEPEREPEELLRWVVGRRAAIVADPGWIEARFSLEDVSLTLRRVGLDLHPDYVVWLGAVVRFTYG